MRQAEQSRRTRETEITVRLALKPHLKSHV